MGLDARGDISAAELAVYVPLLFISIVLVARHGFSRGWIYLLLLAIIRIIGASTHIASELSTTPNTNLHIIYGIMESSGISPLLLSSLGFLGTVKQYGFESEGRLHLLCRLMTLAIHVALGLTIAGGVMVGTNTDPGKVKNGINLRHIGVILFLVEFILIILVTLYLWMNKDRVLKHRRTLLLAISASIPFLAVRVAYTICSAYAPTGIPGVTSGSASLAQFNNTTGSVLIYLIMSVIMEFIVVVIYVTVGIMTPLQKDYAGSNGRWEDEDEEEATKLNARTGMYVADGRTSISYVP